jgi:hypothetical protein
MPSLTVLERSSSSREKYMEENASEKWKKENAVIRIVIGADNDSLTPLPTTRLKEDDDTSACDKGDDIEDFDDDGSFITIESDCEDSDTLPDFSDGEEGNTGSGSFCINPFFN